ncbi:hypothetical protein BLNAU_1569 [Blattamonas nauphoetae]|uniref:Uncharacterized protein n=1 Tax=Blattamonas nauphoetae TaxID=2049346 RepID=A0ABQ9YIE1_9EUKA|nr:hypothetical protein BLNAU_24554 [Blattamonas nauphoetae]KAK2944256.1 hypothetical protein BLNAU_20819 [Blattamonas nauphoetae]KAK2948712.1 hypothetical protein BLNAU_16350 [Blattamonas nauphoetae]KAK2963526.1 hypothetical protein BLNAU_1569 [Blattamonas nauphoetae]
MFRSTLNHTQALISTSINAVCARTNSSEKYRVTELGYCGTTLLTSGNSVSMMILFTSVVDGRFFPVLVICITPHCTCYDCGCPARRSQQR